MFEALWKKFLRRKGLSLWILAVPVLWFVSLIYRLIASLNLKLKSHPVNVGKPVISIGNITVGGTGKTPMVELLASRLMDEEIRVGIVSSGYGRRVEISFVEPGYKVQNLAVEVAGDEVKYLATKLPDAIFSVSSQKVEAAQKLALEKDVDLIIVDDGFQHHTLARDLDIVTYDAAVDEKELKWFPLGKLRESLKAIKRADVILITRAGFAKDITYIRNKLSSINPEAEIYQAQFQATELIGHDRNLPAKYLEDKSVFMFAGIGNFRPFERQVFALSSDLDFALELSDHQEYNEKVLSEIKELIDKYDSDVIITTGKDWTKIENFDFERDIYYLQQTIDLDPGEEKLVSYIANRLGLQKRID